MMIVASGSACRSPRLSLRSTASSTCAYVSSTVMMSGFVTIARAMFSFSISSGSSCTPPIPMTVSIPSV